tara:strand:- start:513 stop:743 length:231 start_codon:yes stop_codon:yes gene_type:complete
MENLNHKPSTQEVIMRNYPKSYECKRLEAEADKILKKKGYNRDGRLRGSVAFKQRQFEGRLCKTPIGGQPRRHGKP